MLRRIIYFFVCITAELIAETSPYGDIALRNPATVKALCCNSEKKLFMGVSEWTNHPHFITNNDPVLALYNPDTLAMFLLSNFDDILATFLLFVLIFDSISTV